MSDELKKYIENKPDGFDIYPFDEIKGWDSQATKLRKKARNIQWMSVAASILLVALVMGLMTSNYKNTERVPAEIAEAEHYYQDQIDAKLVAVGNHPDVAVVIQDLEALDEIFKDLKNDLKDNAQNEEVVTAMIETYRMKLQILERILENIEEGK